MDLEKINKYLPLLGAFSIMGAITGGVFYAGSLKESIDKGLLTPTEKVKLIEHEESAPNEVDNYKAYLRLDSITKIEKKNVEDAIKSRAKRDSILNAAKNTADRNAVQIYQMKQQQDTIIKLLRK